MPPTGPGTGTASWAGWRAVGLVLADGTEVPSGSVPTDGQAHGAADADTALTARWIAHEE